MQTPIICVIPDNISIRDTSDHSQLCTEGGEREKEHDVFQHLPHDYNDKVQHVPAVSDVRVLVHYKSISYNLQKGLYCKNDEEGIFYCFL